MERDVERLKGEETHGLATELVSGMMDFSAAQLAEMLNRTTTPVDGVGSFKFTEEMAAKMQAQFKPLAANTSEEHRARRSENRAKMLPKGFATGAALSNQHKTGAGKGKAGHGVLI